MATRGSAWIVAASVAIGGCQHQVPLAVPGQTEISVSKVEIVPRAGDQLQVDYDPLLVNLGMRVDNAIFPERKFNPFRMAEDRRRIVAYLQGVGRFDAEVDEPQLVYSGDHHAVAVTWHVHEGVAYRISAVEIVGAPPEHLAMLRAMVPFKAGDLMDLDVYRPFRRTLAERLQDEGYGHARGYSRTFVDREHKTIAWFYYMDPGPATRVGSIKVEGNVKIPAPVILERAGLAPGAPYSTAAKRRAELALLDTGAFASATVLSDADIQVGPPEFPETGGVLAPGQVDADGNLIPRHLDDSLAVRVVVVEAPSRQLRAELGIEGDPTRIDAYTGARVWLRNVFGPQQHVVLEGNVGYGWMVGDSKDLAQGVYGSALAQYVHPGWLGTNLDLRVTTRWRDVLYPSSMLREVVAGPGVRSTLARNVFFDLDAYYRVGRQLDMPAIDAMSSAALALPGSNSSQGVELESSLIADRRNDGIEPTSGWYAAARSSYSPGGSFADHRWLQLLVDARGFLPINGAWSLGARASAGSVVLGGENGVPLGARLFGGGPFGMRGFGRDRLSPTACAMSTTNGMCDQVVVGGLSLVESSLELRYLPFRKIYGATAFVDVGTDGAGSNPLHDSVSAAVGLGGRVRSWYLPVAVDFSYRAIDGSDMPATRLLDRLLVFVRVGEAF